MSREPEIKPRNAYEYRRYITLVQALATGDDRKIYALCEAWGVESVPSETVTISRLAQHAIEYHRKEWELEKRLQPYIDAGYRFKWNLPQDGKGGFEYPGYRIIKSWTGLDAFRIAGDDSEGWQGEALDAALAAGAIALPEASE